MVNREIKGTIAKLKERNSIPLRIVTADGSVHLFGIFSEILQTQVTLFTQVERPVCNHLVTISHEGKNDHSPTGCV